MTGLSRGEHLVLSVLRRLAHGWDHCVLATQEIGDSRGGMAETLSTLRVFLVTVARTARRRILVAPPGWLELTADERQILSLVSSAQRRDESTLEALASWSGRLEVRPVLMSAAREVAAALTACGVSAARPAAEGSAGSDLAMSAG